MIVEVIRKYEELNGQTPKNIIFSGFRIEHKQVQQFTNDLSEGHLNGAASQLAKDNL